MIKSILLFLMVFNPGANPACELPEVLKQVLTESKMDLTLVQTDQMIPSIKEYLGADECPTLVQGDFNGDERTDYCALMNSTPLDIIIFEATEESYKIIPFQKITYGIYDSGIGLGMSLFAKRKISGLHDSVDMTGDEIIFEKFEASAFLIYYHAGDYKKMWLAD